MEVFQKQSTEGVKQKQSAEGIVFCCVLSRAVHMNGELHVRTCVHQMHNTWVLNISLLPLVQGFETRLTKSAGALPEPSSSLAISDASNVETSSPGTLLSAKLPNRLLNRSQLSPTLVLEGLLLKGMSCLSTRSVINRRCGNSHY